MKSKISVEDNLIIKRGGRIEGLRFEVSNDACSYRGELALEMWGQYPTIPIREWDKFKGMVDRMIIKAEHLIQEDC